MLALGAVVAGGALHRFRLRRLLELERVRSRIAEDLHDDIGASLAQGAVLSEVARRRADDAATVRKHTEKIATICRELLDSTSDIVWAVSPRYDSLTDLTRRMREFAGELLAGKDIELHFEVSPAEPRLHMGAEMRRQSYLIFKEAVRNAACHSGAAEVVIRLSVEGQWLSLSVADNGCGLGTADGATGNGLSNMRRRAEAMGGNFEATGPREGLVSGFACPFRDDPREYAALLCGRVELRYGCESDSRGDHRGSDRRM